MKNLKVVFILVLLLVTTLVGLSACKNTEAQYDFLDDYIYVVLTLDATLSGEEYTVASFPDLQLRELSEEYVHTAQRKCLVLRLLHPSHERVLEYIRILELRSDVESASHSTSGSIA